jgi:acyl-coenzyme A thioesterase PaaI-like protein
MVTTLLDTAMGGACWTVLEEDESFLTADLRVEFMRSSRPGDAAGSRPRRPEKPSRRVLLG